MKQIMDEDEQVAIMNRMNSNNTDEYMDAQLKNKLDFKKSNSNVTTVTKSFLFEFEHNN